MGNIFKKVSKTNMVNTQSRKNLLYDNIQQELEESKDTIIELKDTVFSIENNYAKLLKQVNTEIVSVKNEMNTILTNNSSFSNNITKINKINNELENEIQELRNRIVILESNDQFHSIIE